VGGVRTDSKHLKQVLEVAAGNEGHFEFQQGVLAEIHVDGMNLGGIIEQVIQRIAACAGDHDDFRGGIESEHLAIEPRVLPGTVVDEIGAMDVLEDDVVGGLEDGACGVFNHASKETRSRPTCEHSRVSLSSRTAAVSLTLGHRQLERV